MEVPSYAPYADQDWPEPQKGHAAMITRMDRDLGRLMELLREMRKEKDTVVIFTSDNGPHREGGNDPDFADSNGPLRGIKRSLHEGGIRVPLIVCWPDHVAAGTESHWIGGFQDFMPTLAELAGASHALPSDLDGVSFARELLGKQGQRDHDYLFWAFYEGGGGRALRRGDWKAIEQPMQTPIRLYRLDRDLHESQNVADDHPELVNELVQQMDQAYQPTERWQFPQGD
jgi:uncharacterized sulfatase